MGENVVTCKVTLELDGTWASSMTRDEIAEYIKDRLNSSLGFRGQITRFSMVDKKGSIQ